MDQGWHWHCSFGPHLVLSMFLNVFCFIPRGRWCVLVSRITNRVSALLPQWMEEHLHCTSLNILPFVWQQFRQYNYTCWRFRHPFSTGRSHLCFEDRCRQLGFPVPLCLSSSPSVCLVIVFYFVIWLLVLVFSFLSQHLAPYPSIQLLVQVFNSLSKYSTPCPSIQLLALLLAYLPTCLLALRLRYLS